VTAPTMTHCPTCSSLVRLHTDPEGASHYEPIRSEPTGVVIAHGDELATNETYTLEDGRTLTLRVARGAIR